MIPNSCVLVVIFCFVFLACVHFIYLFIFNGVWCGWVGGWRGAFVNI